MFTLVFIHQQIFIVIPLLIWITFCTIKFTFTSNDISLVNVFVSFISVIIMKTLRYKSPALLGTRTLLGKLLRVL